MIETPKAIFKLEEIAQADSLLEALVLGTSDLVKDLHARHTPSRVETQTALSLSVLAARAYGLCVLDGVHLSLDDEGGLMQSCIQGRDMGFDGKTLIHPNQIKTANETFGPSPQEIAEAQEILCAQHGISKEEAYRVIRDQAMQKRVTAEEIARYGSGLGQLPDGVSVTDLLRLCHPDRHQGANNDRATAVTRWLLEQREK